MFYYFVFQCIFGSLAVQCTYQFAPQRVIVHGSLWRVAERFVGLAQAHERLPVTAALVGVVQARQAVVGRSAKDL